MFRDLVIENQISYPKEILEMISLQMGLSPPPLLFFRLNGLPLIKKSETAYLMNCLEAGFYKNPQGFYMFYEPKPKNANYVKGESWAEVWWTNPNDFKLDFDEIGVRYSSYKDFAEETDKFGSKYYCSYYDPIREQAFYLRNPLLDGELRKVFDGVTLHEISSAYQKAKQEIFSLIDEEEAKKREQGGELSIDEMHSIISKSFNPSKYLAGLDSMLEMYM